MRMTLIIVCGLAMSTAHAGVYKCKSGKQVIYSDTPCPNAKVVDTTNAKSPPMLDVEAAHRRNYYEAKAVVNGLVAAKLEKQKQQRCNSMARDHAVTQAEALKHADDTWWKTRANESHDRLNTECKGYLIP